MAKFQKASVRHFNTLVVSWEGWNAQRLRGPGGGLDPHQGLQQVLPTAAHAQATQHTELWDTQTEGLISACFQICIA